MGKRGWGDGGGSVRRFFIADIVVVRSHDILLPLDTFKNHCLLLPLKISFFFVTNWRLMFFPALQSALDLPVLSPPRRVFCDRCFWS